MPLIKVYVYVKEDFVCKDQESFEKNVHIKGEEKPQKKIPINRTIFYVDEFLTKPTQSSYLVVLIVTPSFKSWPSLISFNSFICHFKHFIRFFIITVPSLVHTFMQFSSNNTLPRWNTGSVYNYQYDHIDVTLHTSNRDTGVLYVIHLPW